MVGLFINGAMRLVGDHYPESDIADLRLWRPQELIMTAASCTRIFGKSGLIFEMAMGITMACGIVERENRISHFQHQAPQSWRLSQFESIDVPGLLSLGDVSYL